MSTVPRLPRPPWAQGDPSLQTHPGPRCPPRTSLPTPHPTALLPPHCPPLTSPPAPHLRPRQAFDRLEKLSREREPYLRAALAAFRNEIAEQLGTFLTQAADDLAALTKRRFASGGSTRAAVGAGQPRSPIHQMTVLPSLLLSPALRSAAVSPDLVTRLAAFATAVTSPGVSFTGLPEFRESLVQTMAALQEHAPALVGASGGPRPGGDGASEAAQAAPPPAALVEATATALVPALAEVVGNPEADSEMR